MATVINRGGKVTASIFEIKAILEDIKIHSLGAIKCGMEIFELAVVPMLPVSYTHLTLPTNREV